MHDRTPVARGGENAASIALRHVCKGSVTDLDRKNGNAKPAARAIRIQIRFDMLFDLKLGTFEAIAK
ncbi:hypothetical protein CGZ80_00805 [Rhodopirellula sp. MGV]|nr:hypothetical protein CGZ80_18685 [Rhodopirellula sp. MGV]OYP39213.1 hypothetical protein CGZ80_00805 [Rhodopirellula sp. MGV]PNY35411.1 hypothetical protein C2E31_18030 [Rhodopirellula baltica]